MNNNKLLLLLLLVLPFFLSAQSKPQKEAVKAGNYIIKIIPAGNAGYGYDIYKGKTLVIHQPSVPALPGNSGFATKAAAEKVAGKVVEKMQKGESLPTLTIEELNQLGVIPKR
jgi:hypothetical protein